MIHCGRRFCALGTEESPSVEEEAVVEEVKVVEDRRRRRKEAKRPTRAHPDTTTIRRQRDPLLSTRVAGTAAVSTGAGVTDSMSPLQEKDVNREQSKFLFLKEHVLKRRKDIIDQFKRLLLLNFSQTIEIEIYAEKIKGGQINFMQKMKSVL